MLRIWPTKLEALQFVLATIISASMMYLTALLATKRLRDQNALLKKDYVTLGEQLKEVRQHYKNERLNVAKRVIKNLGAWFQHREVQMANYYIEHKNKYGTIMQAAISEHKAKMQKVIHTIKKDV